MATFICDAIRGTLETDCVVYNSGGIRADRDYKEKVTLKDIKEEMPFGLIVPLCLPGDKLAQLVTSSRQNWIDNPTKPDGFALQADRGVQVSANNVLTHVAGEPLVTSKEYSVALPDFLLTANPVLAEFIKANPNAAPSKEAGRPPVSLVVEYLTKQIWHELLDADKDGTVTEDELLAFLNTADTNKNGAVDEGELFEALKARLGDRGEVVLHQMMMLLDDDKSGDLDMEELRKLHPHASDKDLDHLATKLGRQQSVMVKGKNGKWGVTKVKQNALV